MTTSPGGSELDGADSAPTAAPVRSPNAVAWYCGIEAALGLMVFGWVMTLPNQRPDRRVGVCFSDQGMMLFAIQVASLPCGLGLLLGLHVTTRASRTWSTFSVVTAGVLTAPILGVLVFGLWWRMG